MLLLFNKRYSEKALLIESHLSEAAGNSTGSHPSIWIISLPGWGTLSTKNQGWGVYGEFMKQQRGQSS